jgi:predicted acetyltransferase
MLIAEEGSRNPMTSEQLLSRMRAWWESGWDLWVILRNLQPVGYALGQLRPDEYQPSQQDFYLRQFYINENFRRQGLGKKAIELIVELYSDRTSTLVLEVLAANSPGRRFWEAVGFQAVSITMKHEKA